MTNIISVSIKGTLTDTDSDFTKKDEKKNSKSRISFKEYFELIEIKKYNSLPLIIYKKEENQNNDRNIYLHDKIIEKIYRNFEINTVFVNNKQYYENNNDVLGPKVKNENKIINKNINNEEKISNMSTKDSLSLFRPKTCKNIIDFAFCKKNYCNYIPKQKDMNNKPSQKPQIFPIRIFLGIASHNEIGDKYCLNIKDNTFCSENDSYKIIEQKGHIFLNHLFQKNSKAYSTPIRYRHKNITFVYYK